MFDRTQFVFSFRSPRGENPAEESVLEAVSKQVGLDPARILEAAFDDAKQQALTAQVQRDYDEHDIFGVPTLILPRGSRFWGHDRIEWALAQGEIPGSRGGG